MANHISGRDPIEIYKLLWDAAPDVCQPQDWLDGDPAHFVGFCGKMAVLIHLTLDKIVSRELTTDEGIADIACSPCDECPLNIDNLGAISGIHK